MSKSRLEKFLYALYSLDSSDLPNPLSRIEELYKCLVTGEEVPTFKPISRVEKYLMVILGVYDVDSLPNPLSRVEVLLYKLATGDDSLEDFDTFLSEHEELLAEIIRNGGVGGNIDIEYVIYTLSTEFNTLYNTEEKPVKSAILKGQTLVNNLKEITLPVQSTSVGNIDIPIITKINEGERYYAYVDIEVPSGATRNLIGLLGNSDWQSYPPSLKSGINKVALDAKSDLTEALRIQADNGTILRSVILMKENVEFINQFWGMKSVQMPVLTTTGKNLFDVELEQGGLNSDNGSHITTNASIRTKDFIELSPNKTFSISKTLGTKTVTILIYDNDKNFVGSTWNQTFTLNENERYIKITDSDNNLENLYQIEEGSTITPYEPFKSNILTANEDVELRGIGDVRDELDLLTGEVVNKFGEIVLNGDENWSLYASQPNQVNTVAFKLSFTNHVSSWITGLGYCDKLSFTNGGVMYGQDLECVTTDANNLIVRVSLSKVSSVDKFKAWLSNNNIRVVYPFKEEVIKTVDLSVVDQDGNNTKLSTFDDITHVTLSSEGLIPEAELEVATKNEEVLNTLSLEMDDISTVQTTLDETSNTQSENVDSTMLATTEIYEGLL